MSYKLLTPDNLQLSELTGRDDRGPQSSAINCKAETWSDPDDYPSAKIGADVAALVASSISGNTRRAYCSDLAHFGRWGGAIPARPEEVASYIAACAGAMSVATIVRRAASISKTHDASGHRNPCRSELVRSTLRGLKRTYGRAQQQARPLLREDLFAVLDHIGDSVKDHRDRALLLVGFAGGFRRSELVGLDRRDVTFVREGVAITIRRSKTDQEGEGRRIGIPLGRTRYCPVSALETWLLESGIKQDAVFRPVDRHSQIASDRLSGDAVSSIVKERVCATGMASEGFSGHSLRAGFATSAARACIATSKIRAQTGHASDAMLARYVRDGELFLGNAAGLLL